MISVEGNFNKQKLTIRSNPLHARIRFGEKWRASSKRHKCKKENGGLGDEGKNKNLHALKMDGMSLKGSSEHEGSGLENASYVKAI